MAITMEELRKKAQRYDEALEKAKRLYEKGTITESLGYVFPELKESEGERIRKELMDFVVDNTICKDGRREKWIAWLEKQGEKLSQQEVTKISDQVKGSDWSEEDEKMLDDAIGAVGAADYYTYDDKQEIENWLKSLKQRIGG